MARPKIKEEKRRIQLSVSLSPSVMNLADKVENKSHFLDTSVETSHAVSIIIRALKDKTISFEEALEQIEDAADIWEAEFDESLPFHPSTAPSFK